MNQEKIGKFIQESRKKKELTQEQLAEKLGITKNAVSKWERGLSLMDMSLLKPLSEILDVSIIEIINGEKIEDKELTKKSEEAIEKTIKHSKLKINKTKKKLLILASIILLIMSIVVHFSYKMQVLMLYNVEKKDSEYIEDLLEGLNNQREITISPKYLDMGEYLEWQGIKIRNDFEGMTIRAMGTDQILYEVKSSDKTKRKYFYMYRGSTYLEEIEDYFEAGWANVKLKDIKKFCLEKEIYDDIDFINYVKDRYYAENTLLTSTKQMRENYIINLFVSYYLQPVKRTTILKGTYNGYMFEREDYYEIHLLHNNQKYVFIFYGQEYAKEEYILDILSTIEIR